MGPVKEAIASLISGGQLVALALVFAGAKIFAALRMPPPQWYFWIEENKVMATISIFLVSTLAGKLKTSGAFEVFVDGQLVSSKIATGRVLSIEGMVDELIRRGLHPRADYQQVLAQLAVRQ